LGGNSKYIPALDGLRTFAVVAVVLYHMVPGIVPCGLLGVTMFFVLSGYLITGILIREWHANKKINLPRFWIRRVRRLFPAIVFMICVVAILSSWLAPDLLTKLRRDALSALFWFSNWWYIFQDVSYFEAAGAPSPVNHFWSLAIEEQFYLIWPPILLLLFSRKVKKDNIQRACLALAAVSALLMFFFYEPDADPSRIYYGTDTRAFSLLIGAWAAFVFPRNKVLGLGKHGLAPRIRKIIGYAGIVSALAILVIMFAVPTYSPFLYCGGLVIVSILTCVLIISLVDNRNIIARFFSAGPLVAIGKISYGIYIWHFPLLLLMNDYNSTIATPWYMYILQFLVIVAVAAFSYKFVENPIRHGAFGRMYKALKEQSITLAQLFFKHALQIVFGAALILGAVVAFAITPDTATQSNTNLTSASVIPDSLKNNREGEETQNADDDALKSAAAARHDISNQVIPEDIAAMSREELLSHLGSNASLSSLSDKTLQQLVATAGEDALQKAHNTAFVMVGDSVSVAIGDNGGYGGFGENFPNAILDALLNRRAIDGKGIYNSYAVRGWNGPVVIFALATNTQATEEGINQMINAAPEGKMVFVVNARTPGSQQDGNNALLAAAAAAHPNVQVIDWYGISAGHDEYFDGDGTHLTGVDGVNAYISAILDALQTLY
jgi:peptidoglycan/LPS O-acetylase OafA/YrhL